MADHSDGPLENRTENALGACRSRPSCRAPPPSSPEWSIVGYRDINDNSCCDNISELGCVRDVQTRFIVTRDSEDNLEFNSAQEWAGYSCDDDQTPEDDGCIGEP